ncbi:MAG: hypothetical protein J3Q66DRAFT_401738 [Benniella sp.]|nr:MAG: hypothetical protein J3Q66DRAFT_401738 [Benniella sp.]
MNPTGLMIVVRLPTLARLDFSPPATENVGLFVKQHDHQSTPIENRKRHKSDQSPQMTPEQRDPSPSRVATTSTDSSKVIPATFSEKSTFLDDLEEDDLMVPDSTESSYRFSAMLDGQDVGGSFGHLFQDIKPGFIHQPAQDIRAQKENRKKNSKDLVRVGEMLKNALDRLQDDFSITDAVVPSRQVIAQVLNKHVDGVYTVGTSSRKAACDDVNNYRVMNGLEPRSNDSMSIYIMSRCGTLYILVHVEDTYIPDSLTGPKTLGANIKTWLELKATFYLDSNMLYSKVFLAKSRRPLLGRS